ncbi:MAG: hypothetical protein ABEI74_05055 [Candidatus Pacearchaeota archaeon]
MPKTYLVSYNDIRGSYLVDQGKYNKNRKYINFKDPYKAAEEFKRVLDPKKKSDIILDKNVPKDFEKKLEDFIKDLTKAEIRGRKDVTDM